MNINDVKKMVKDGEIVKCYTIISSVIHQHRQSVGRYQDILDDIVSIDTSSSLMEYGRNLSIYARQWEIMKNLSEETTINFKKLKEKIIQADKFNREILLPSSERYDLAIKKLNQDDDELI